MTGLAVYLAASVVVTALLAAATHHGEQQARAERAQRRTHSPR